MWTRWAMVSSNLHVNFWARARHLSANSCGFSILFFRAVYKLHIMKLASMDISKPLPEFVLKSLPCCLRRMHLWTSLVKILSQNLLVSGQRSQNSLYLATCLSWLRNRYMRELFQRDCWVWVWTLWHEGKEGYFFVNSRCPYGHALH